MPPYINLVHWQWNTDDPGFNFWHVPGALGLIDLRSLPQMSVTGGSPQGYAIATFADPIVDAGAVYLGDDPTGPMPLARKRSMAQELGFDLRDLDSVSSLSSALWRVLTIMGDPTGASVVKPLSGPGRQYVISMGLTGFPLRRERFHLGHPAAANVLAIVQAGYWRIKSELQAKFLSDDPRYYHARKMLGGLLRKFRVSDPAELGLAGELWDKPTTTITDDFNRADSDSLGANWVEVDGDWDILSNQIRSNGAGTNPNAARHATNLSSNDHYTEIVVKAMAGTGYLGAAVRFKSDAETYYMGISRPSGSLRGIYKVVTGTLTALVTDSGGVAAPITIKLEVGNTGDNDLEQFVDAASVLTNTDTSIPDNLQCGLVGHNADTSDGDDFEAADLAAAGVEIFRRRIEGY